MKKFLKFITQPGPRGCIGGFVILVVLVVLAVYSGNLTESPEQPRTGLPVAPDIYAFHARVEGHDYVIFRYLINREAISAVHSPNCSCHKKK